MGWGRCLVVSVSVKLAGAVVVAGGGGGKPPGEPALIPPHPPPVPGPTVVLSPAAHPPRRTPESRPSQPRSPIPPTPQPSSPAVHRPLFLPSFALPPRRALAHLVLRPCSPFLGTRQRPLVPVVPAFARPSRPTLPTFTSTSTSARPFSQGPCSLLSAQAPRSASAPPLLARAARPHLTSTPPRCSPARLFAPHFGSAPLIPRPRPSNAL